MTDAAAQQKAIGIAASRAGRTFYRMVWYLIRGVLYPYFKVRTRHGERLDAPGPLILAPVHRSNLDAPLIAVLGKRQATAIAKESLFKNPVFGWVVSALGAFPVDRGQADREALASAQRLLENGASMFVFPEGTRQEGELVGEVYDGAAFLSARTGAPVLPIGIAGTDKAMPPGAKVPRRRRVAIVVGEPMQPLVSESGKVSMKQRRAFTADLKEALQQVYDEAQAESEQV